MYVILSVFGNTISLIYNPIFKWISWVSKMAKFWRERILEREKERKVWNSYNRYMIPFVGQIDKA